MWGFRGLAKILVIHGFWLLLLPERHVQISLKGNLEGKNFQYGYVFEPVQKMMQSNQVIASQFSLLHPFFRCLQDTYITSHLQENAIFFQKVSKSFP